MSKQDHRDLAVHIQADGIQEHVLPRNGKDFTLKEAQAYVGGYVEVVDCGLGMILLVDEDGMLKGLRRNRVASAMAGTNVVGDALLCPSQMFP